ncbi:uncharacterized protein [Montipora foliosa]|uniref:uncharacterized protein n=1 Tax=Montipora foliosa TaxID=591990 RepID=UPI0035F12003
MSENVIAEVLPQSEVSQVQSAQTEGNEQAADDPSDVADSTENQTNDDDNEPPKKKARKSTPKKADNSAAAGQDKYHYARSRGIRIFSDREIESQDAEMTKEYWRFWNDTAEELCSDRAYNDWGKRDLKLYIDAAWIIHKTYLQELRERELAEWLQELQEKYGYSELPAKLKTQDQAVTTALSKLQDSTANLNELNLELSRSRGKAMNLKQRQVNDAYTSTQKEDETRLMNKQISELEKTLYEGMSEVKRDQDSMKKALNRQKTLVFKARQERP